MSSRVALGDPPRYSSSTRSTPVDSAIPIASARARARAAGTAPAPPCLGADRGDVDGGRDDAAGERGDHLLGGLDAGAVLRPVVEEAAVGVTTMPIEAEQRVWSVTGSLRTRRARRPRPCRDERAAFSASSSTSSPRAQLTIRTPSRTWRAPSFSQPWVSGVFGRWIEMKSACAYSSSAVSALLDAELAEAIARHVRVVRRHGACRTLARAGRRAGLTRLNPSRLSVFSYSSTPPHFERSSCRRSAPSAPAGRCAQAPAAGRPCARRP